MREALESIFSALNAAQVRYLVVGGLAVVAHGYVRTTVDVDLVLDLERENVLRAMEALRGLEYAPRVPVEMTAFADEATRRDWSENRNMIVFSLTSRRFPQTEVDVFVEPPFDFNAVYDKATRVTLSGVELTIVARDTLLEMKRQAGRPQDLADIANLRDIGS